MMAQLPTLCEVSYDPKKDVWDEEITPYRYRSISARFKSSQQIQVAKIHIEGTQSARDFINTSASFYEPYMVGNRTPLGFATPLRVPSVFSSLRREYAPDQPPSRSFTSHNNYYSHNGEYQPSIAGYTADHRSLVDYADSRYPESLFQPSEMGYPTMARRVDRARTAPCASLPNLPSSNRRMSVATTSKLHLGEEAGAEQEKLKWMPSLNSWVNESQNPVPYSTFVNSIQLWDRASLPQEFATEGADFPSLPCGRYLAHMHMHQEAAKTIELQKLAELNRKRRIRLEKEAAIDRLKEVKPPTPAKSPTKVRFVPPTPPRTPTPPPQPHREPTPPRTPPAPPSDIKQDSPEISPSPEKFPTPPPPKIPTLPPRQPTTPQPPPTKDPTPPPNPAPPPRDPTPPPPPPPAEPAPPEPIKKKKEKPLKPAKVAKATVDEQVKPTLDFTIRSEHTEDDFEEENSSVKSREKRVRWRAQYKGKEKPPSETPTPDPETGPMWDHKKVSDWIYSDDSDLEVPQVDDFFKNRPKDEESSMDAIPPSLPSTPVAKPKPKKKKSAVVRGEGDWGKHRWGKKKLDKSYEEELRRQELAEERRRKQQEMYDALRSTNKSNKQLNDNASNEPKFEDFGFLARYCILNKGAVDMYRKAFEVVDEDQRGWLSSKDTLVALRAVNRSLSTKEEEYITRILEVTGYKMSDGADFKLFAVIAALSQKVAELDEWMKTLIGQIDFRLLNLKLYMYKTLWECNVDPDTNTIPLDQLCVELRAGGVSPEHIQEVRDKLSHIYSLDLLDFLTYIPLFLMIHNSVVTNPLDNRQDI